jgi:hypothetical protein
MSVDHLTMSHVRSSLSISTHVEKFNSTISHQISVIGFLCSIVAIVMTLFTLYIDKQSDVDIVTFFRTNSSTLLIFIDGRPMSSSEHLHIVNMMSRM